MTRLEGAQFQLHLHGLNGDVALTSNDDTTIEGSIVDDKDRTVDLPMGANWRFGFGGTHKMDSGLELTPAYELAWGGNLSLDQRSPLAGRLSGEYQSVALHFLGATLHWGAGRE